MDYENGIIKFNIKKKNLVIGGRANIIQVSKLIVRCQLCNSFDGVKDLSDGTHLLTDEGSTWCCSFSL